MTDNAGGTAEAAFRKPQHSTDNTAGPTGSAADATATGARESCPRHPRPGVSRRNPTTDYA